jgi:hypothetical protein
MKKLNIAKETLLDPERRKKYDSKIKSNQTDDFGISFVVSETDDEIEELEIDWEFDESFENGEPKENWDYSNNYDNSSVIHSPPVPPFPRQSYDPVKANTLGFEVSPGVLFLQKCIKCGRTNFHGTPVCLGCNSSLIFDNHQYTSSGQNPDSIFRTPTQPGFIPGVRPEMIIIKKCLKCGVPNQNNSPVCQNCNSSLVYYQRPLIQDRPGANGYPDNISVSMDHGVFECPKCGAENDPGRKHCYSCYSNLQNVRKEVILDSSQDKPYQRSTPGSRNDASKRCPNCARFNHVSRDFCHHCNTRLVYSQPPIEIESSDKNLKQIEDEIKKGKIECPHCGIENPVDEEICTSCYKNILPRDKISYIKKEINDWSNSTADIRREYYYYGICPRCGFKNGSESKFCVKCGLEI